MAKKGVTVKEARPIEIRKVDMFYSDDEIIDLFPDDSETWVNKLLRRAQKAEDDCDKANADCAAMTAKLNVLHAIASAKAGTERFGDWNWTKIKADIDAILKDNPGQPFLDRLDKAEALVTTFNDDAIANAAGEQADATHMDEIETYRNMVRKAAEGAKENPDAK